MPLVLELLLVAIFAGVYTTTEVIILRRRGRRPIVRSVSAS
jgi:hypothetical protein